MKGYITTRNHVAIAAHQRSGAGKHGGSSKQKNRRDRKAARQNLRRRTYDN